MQTIEIPLSEYESLKEQVKLLKDTELLKKVNKLLDLLYEEKLGLYMGNYTEDLVEGSINESWNNRSNKWNAI